MAYSAFALIFRSFSGIKYAKAAKRYSVSVHVDDLNWLSVYTQRCECHAVCRIERVHGESKGKIVAVLFFWHLSTLPQVGVHLLKLF